MRVDPTNRGVLALAKPLMVSAPAVSNPAIIFTGCMAKTREPRAVDPVIEAVGPPMTVEPATDNMLPRNVYERTVSELPRIASSCEEMHS